LGNPKVKISFHYAPFMECKQSENGQKLCYFFSFSLLLTLIDLRWVHLGFVFKRFPHVHTPWILEPINIDHIPRAREMAKNVIHNAHPCVFINNVCICSCSHLSHIAHIWVVAPLYFPVQPAHNRDMLETLHAYYAKERVLHKHFTNYLTMEFWYLSENFICGPFIPNELITGCQQSLLRINTCFLDGHNWYETSGIGSHN